MTPRSDDIALFIPASNSLDSPRALLPELHRNKENDRCAALSAEVPRPSQKKSDANLDCAFVENALFTTNP